MSHCVVWSCVILLTFWRWWKAAWRSCSCWLCSPASFCKACPSVWSGWRKVAMRKSWCWHGNPHPTYRFGLEKSRDLRQKANHINNIRNLGTSTVHYVLSDSRTARGWAVSEWFLTIAKVDANLPPTGHWSVSLPLSLHNNSHISFAFATWKSEHPDKRRVLGHLKLPWPDEINKWLKLWWVSGAWDAYLN